MTPRRRSSPGRFNLVGKGVYALVDAERLTQVPARRISRWTRGYDFTFRGVRRHATPVVGSRAGLLDGQPVLTFLDLIEIRFLDAFLSHGVSMHAIRIASKRARELLGRDRPFSTKLFKTDGRTILAEIQPETGDAMLLDLVRDQFEFRRIISDYLYAGLEYDDHDEPNRWYPTEGRGSVVIDPARAFGAPIIARKGLQTRLVVRALQAGETAASIASWYDLSSVEVKHAEQFEASVNR